MGENAQAKFNGGLLSLLENMLVPDSYMLFLFSR